MTPLQEQFVAEARELVHQATADLIAAERDGFSPERIDSVFRAFHTLKGSAGVVDLPAMALTVHAAEDLLAAIQAGRLTSSASVINQVLACLDQVSAWVTDFETRQALPSRAGEDAREMADHLRALVTGSASVGAIQGTASPSETAVPDWVTRLIDAHRERIRRDARAGAETFFAVFYEPHAGCFFNGDDPLELLRRAPNLLALHIEAREAWPPLGELDPYSCNLRLLAISAGPQTELASVFRLVPDQVRIIAIPRTVLPAPTDGQAEHEIDGLVRAVVEEQRRVIAAAQEREDHAGRFGAAARAAANALRHSRRDHWAERIERAGAAAVSQSDALLLLSALDEAFSALLDNGGDDSGPDHEAATRTENRSLRVDEVENRRTAGFGWRASRREERVCASRQTCGTRGRRTRSCTSNQG